MAAEVEIAVKRITRFDGQGKAKAFCDVVLGEAFLIKGIKVLEGKKGLFVSMPRQQGKDGNWYDTVLPLTREARQQICEVVLMAYQAGAEEPSTGQGESEG